MSVKKCNEIKTINTVFFYNNNGDIIYYIYCFVK